MTNYERLENALLSKDDGFLMTLRFGKGFNINKVDEILLILTDIKKEYSNSQNISKDICNLFVDFYQAVDGSLSLYSSEQVSEIIKVSDIIQDAIRECLII